MAVVLGADLVFPLNLTTLDVREAAASDNLIFTSACNDAGGVTNGFYVGAPRVLSVVLRRYDEFERHMHIRNDYEAVLKSAFELNGIERRVTRAVFFKVRASGEGPAFRGNGPAVGARHVVWQGGPKMPLAATEDDEAQILREAQVWRATCFHPCETNVCFATECFPPAPLAIGVRRNEWRCVSDACVKQHESRLWAKEAHLHRGVNEALEVDAVVGARERRTIP